MKKMWIVLLFLTACAEKSGMPQSDDSELLAQVGDVAITDKMVAVVLKARGLTNVNAQQSQAVFELLVKDAAMAHQAVKNKLPLNADQIAAIQYQQMKFQAQNALQAYLEANPVTDEDIAAEYKAVLEATKGMQFHVQHLLFQDEVNALKVLDQVISGQLSFDEALKIYLSERPNMKNVGDIGWVNLQQIPETFHKPLQSMPLDSVNPDVVLSQFGAHVLYLKDKKADQPPSLEQAKAGIKKTLVQRAVSKYEQLAVAKAQVKLVKK